MAPDSRPIPIPLPPLDEIPARHERIDDAKMVALVAIVLSSATMLGLLAVAVRALP